MLQPASTFSIKNIFKPDYENYEGVRKINIYVMRLFFTLMFLFVGTDSWMQKSGGLLRKFVFWGLFYLTQLIFGYGWHFDHK